MNHRKMNLGIHANFKRLPWRQAAHHLTQTNQRASRNEIPAIITNQHRNHMRAKANLDQSVTGSRKANHAKRR